MYTWHRKTISAASLVQPDSKQLKRDHAMILEVSKGILSGGVLSGGMLSGGYCPGDIALIPSRCSSKDSLGSLGVEGNSLSRHSPHAILAFMCPGQRCCLAEIGQTLPWSTNSVWAALWKGLLGDSRWIELFPMNTILVWAKDAMVLNQLVVYLIFFYFWVFCIQIICLKAYKMFDITFFFTFLLCNILSALFFPTVLTQHAKLGPLFNAWTWWYCK